MGLRKGLREELLALSFFHLEDAGMMLIRGARDKGVVTDEDLENAYKLGMSI